MKKSTIIIIAIVYLASIALISFFGMKVTVYSQVVNVESVECINTSDSSKNILVEYENGIKTIKIPFTSAFDPATPQKGTKIQLLARAYPDNATNKTIDFEKDPLDTRFEFSQNELGKTGLVMIYQPMYAKIKIWSTDGTLKYQEIAILAYKV